MNPREFFVVWRKRWRGTRRPCEGRNRVWIDESNERRYGAFDPGWRSMDREVLRFRKRRSRRRRSRKVDLVMVAIYHHRHQHHERDARGKERRD